MVYVYLLCARTVGTCTNLPGTYECACQPGYQVDAAVTANPTTASSASWDSNSRMHCIDINECALNQTICGVAAAGNTCTNTDGVYACDCAEGFYFVNGTCLETAEIWAYDQVCGNKMAHPVATPNGPTHCKCLRTFYKNRGGYCLQASHVLEFRLVSSAPFSGDLEDESQPRYQSLAAMAEQWTLGTCLQSRPLGRGAKRVAVRLVLARSRHGAVHGGVFCRAFRHEKRSRQSRSRLATCRVCRFCGRD